MASIIKKVVSRINRYNPKVRVPRRIVSINGIQLDLSDHPTSIVREEVKECLEDDVYGIESIKFKLGDVAIDVGANIGVVSIYLAKKYPDILIYSYEPIPSNYQSLVTNIENNHVTNIKAFNLALTKDRRDIKMIVHSSSNSGGGTACLENMNLENGHQSFIIQSITLDDVFQQNSLKACRFLKIDVEGSEHEILLNSESLSLVENLGAEFHINSHLKNQGYSNEGLENHCRTFFQPEKMRIKSINMAE